MMKGLIYISVCALAFTLLLTGCISAGKSSTKVNLRDVIQSDPATVVGKLPGNTSPGEGWNYINDAGGGDVIDWATEEDYFFIENDKARFHIGINTFPMDEKDPFGSGIFAKGSTLPGTVVDAVEKTHLIENLDFTEFVLLPIDATDHRNWWYPWHKLRLPDISINEEDKSISARGTWDYRNNIQANVKYSMVQDAPMLKIDVTLENTSNNNFRGDLGYIFYLYNPRGSGTASVRNGYIPGQGWFIGGVPSPANGGSALYYGWKGNYVMMGRAEGYSGETCHAIIWGGAQPPRALIPSGYYTGAWFRVNVPAKESTTVTFLHLVYHPERGEEAFEQAAHWAAEVNK